jgi:hypothetical protein
MNIYFNTIFFNNKIYMLKEDKSNDGENKIVEDTSEVNTIINNNTLLVEWTEHHEKILIDWTDKATCYKWLHEKSQYEFAKKSRWFTIPVIVMSTLTGTANFAQDKIPAEYLNMATMIIGGVNLIAGIITTVQQFLKINELNESHRVSAISWGKFQRNLQVELAKAPSERTQAIHLIKVAKEEYDRLIETSNPIPTHIIALFKKTFSGGEIEYDNQNISKPLNNKQILFNELSKPEICDALESVKKSVYKETNIDIENKKLNYENAVLVAKQQSLMELERKKRTIVENFIISFEKETNRLPSKDEIIDNIDIDISPAIIASVLSDIEIKHIDNSYSDA